MTCAQSTNIHVAVRVRPFNRRETASGAKRVMFFETGEHDNVNAHEGIAVIKNPNFSAAGEAVTRPPLYTTTYFCVLLHTSMYYYVLLCTTSVHYCVLLEQIYYI